MQLRQPLHVSCWMKTVSNSVRTMALVGQTSRQEACWQCLHTSDIISQACPSPTVVAAVSELGSMNLTWRQFSASSLPVLSKLSARNFGGVALGWFHSFDPTPRALPPRPCLASADSA